MNASKQSMLASTVSQAKSQSSAEKAIEFNGKPIDFKWTDRQTGIYLLTNQI